MSQRLTPLSRNQLLELEALLQGLITIVSQPPPTPQPSNHGHVAGTPVFVGDRGWPSSAPSTPTALTTIAGKPITSASPSHSGAAAGAGAGVGFITADALSYDGAPFPHQDGSPSGATAAVADAPPHADHAALHGTFIDVFTDALTLHTWRLYDKILYLVWWSYCPAACAKCGMQDAWLPSGDVEFKCAFCIAGAGTTRSNAVVLDAAGNGEEGEDYGYNNSGDDDDGDEKDKEGGGGNGGGGGSGGGGGGGGPLETYTFFYEWLQHIPHLDGSRGSSGTTPAADRHAVGSPSRAGGGGAGSGNVAFDSGSGGGPKRLGSTHTSKAMAHQPSSTGPANTASSSILLPRGEALPTVLRAAYDMACVLTAPGLPRGTAVVMRAATLYVSLLLHRFVSLFPLFCIAGRGVRGGGEGKTSTADNRTTAADAEGQRVEVELQWVDIELVSILLGVAAPSFFESTEVSVQHLQNVFTVAAAYGVPSVLWHPGRVPGRVEVMKALRDKVVPLCPLHATTAGVSGLCPEHTAMVVALELARRVDAHPVATSSTSPAAAAQNAQRIGLWLDALGLYPTRRVYRDVHSFHRLVEEEARQQQQQQQQSDGTLQAAQDEEEEAERRRSGAARAWEASLTDLAAVKDGHLTHAAECHARRHEIPDAAAAAPLIVPRSPFFRRFEWILTSPCANALLHVFAAVFRMTPMELADMALRSGIYQGHASGFVAALKTAVAQGAFDVMPLARRLSPLTSSWMAPYMALHSTDRLPLLATLAQMSEGENVGRERQVVLTRLLQRILRKHHAAQIYQFNFVLRVTDEDEKHFNGVYFLSSVLWQEGLAVFTCLRSGRKTITLNRFSRSLSLCYMNAKEKVVQRLSMHVVSPVVAAIETESARLVMEMALGAVARGVNTLGDPWGTVVRCLDKCARVRRRMRVPMLASRLDALASIHEQAKSTVRGFQQFPPLPSSNVKMGPTLLGWGETETLLSSAPRLELAQLRKDLQWNLLALPHVSLLFGLSENRVVAMYASLVALLELIHERLAGQVTTATPASASANNWVEELLFVEEDGEDDAVAAAEDFMHSFRSPFAEASRTGGLGWSPPTYRNSHGGTPQRSRSPNKSKFVTVSTSTNATSAFATTFASGGRSGGGSGGGSAAHPPSFVRHTYTATPPSMAPRRSPVLRSNPASSFTSSHNAISTPVHRFQPPPPSPSSSVFFGGSGGGGGGVGTTPPLPFTSASNRSGGVKRASGKSTSAWGSDGGGADGAAPLLPDLELSESTADVEKRRSSAGGGSGSSSGSGGGLLPSSCSRRADRRRARASSDSEAEDSEVEGESSHRDGKDSASGGGGVRAPNSADPQQQALRLLRQTTPPYWEVLLGHATEVALPTHTPGTRPALRRGDVATARREGNNDDDDENDEALGHAVQRESRQRRLGHRLTPEQLKSGGTRTPAAAAAAAALRVKEGGAPPRGEAAVSHHPFNLFDAEECRRRLHRLYEFIGAYLKTKQRCVALAVAGALPELPASPPYSTVVGRTTTTTAATGSSPQTPTRVSGAAVSALLRSPHVPPLPPPPPYPAGGRGINNSSSGGGGGGISPPPLFGQSPQRSGESSPMPLSTVPTHAPTFAAEDTAVPVVQQQQQQWRGGSPKRPVQRSSTATPLSPPRRASPPQQQQQQGAKLVTGPLLRGRGGRGAASVALVDDADFTLPPSELTWTHEQRQEQLQRVRDGRAARNSSPDTDRGVGAQDRADRAGTVSQKDRRMRGTQQQQQQPASSSSSSSGEEEEEEEEAAAAISLRQPPRKRTRDDNGSDEGDSDADPDAPPPQPKQQQPPLRRKAKKLGRRRRRQEQFAHHHTEVAMQQQQLQGRSSPSRSGSEASRSPEVRAWRNGKVSGSVSPVRNSPALAPRPPSSVEGAASAVPSIRARNARAPESGEDEEGRSKRGEGEKSLTDSCRSADYDTDA